MDRRTLARLVAERVDGLSVRMASAAVEATCEAIAESLAQGEGVTLSNFGTFKTRQRKARQTYHPRTRDPITIPAARTVAFVPSPKLQEQVRGDVDSGNAAAKVDS
ncbi:MAG: HU family DNA-binding protein [Cyanobacteria bacterium P01_E01_bin.34]